MLEESVLLVGSYDEKLTKLLNKMGYAVTEDDGNSSIIKKLDEKHFDLILLDADSQGDLVEYVDLLRADPRSKDTPLVVITQDSAAAKQLERRDYERVCLVQGEYRIGSLVSIIATELRLRKIAGADEDTASLADSNIALRELTSHFQKELEDARKIQEALLPKALPKISTAEVSAYYQPLEEVGGDWYYTDENDGKLRIIIADVTGHGLSAAFIGSMTKLAYSACPTNNPNELLAGMNALIAPVIPEGSFITAFAATFDPETKTLHYSRAGHPPPILVDRAAGESIELKGEGFALGFFEEAEYESLSVKMNTGDVFFCYTDALPESQNRDNDTYGYERMKEVLKSSDVALNTAGLIEIVMDDFDDFRDERILKDDVTAIALKCLD